MTHPITTVKKEIRILGLDTCDPNRIIGVVVRGGLFLDGVLVFKPPAKNDRNPLANEIVKIPHYPELRGIMLHNSSDLLNPDSIERLTQLSVITVSHPQARLGKKFIRFQGPRGRLLVETRLPTSILKKILTVTWTDGKFPEPVRVAHLLAKTRFPRNLTR